LHRLVVLFSQLNGLVNLSDHTLVCALHFLPGFTDVLMKLFCASRFHSVFYMLIPI